MGEALKDSYRRLMQTKVVKMLVFAFKFFTTKRTLDAAYALTYSTILSVVPICAVLFAIARGFGFTIYIEEWLRSVLSSQSQASEVIIRFVNNYLEHTKSGIILGIGLVFMLYTVVMLARNVEQTFNDIWHVEYRQNIIRAFTDYIAIFFLFPIGIIIMSGVSLFISTVASHSRWDDYLEPVAQIVVNMLPFMLMWLAFTSLYVLMPNTRVRWLSALWPGLFAAVAMQILQWFYINAQIFISNYNAIYGSFAALPLFMLWVQFSWMICLFGAELCYTNQKLDEFAFSAGASNMSHYDKLHVSIALLGRICHRFAVGQRPYTAARLSKELKAPLSVTRDLLYMLSRAGLLNEITGRTSDSVVRFTPAMEKMTIGYAIRKLEGHEAQKFSVSDLNLDDVNLGEFQEARDKYLESLNGCLLAELCSVTTDKPGK